MVSAYAFQQFCKMEGLKIPSLIALNDAKHSDYHEHNVKFLGGKSAWATSAYHFAWKVGNKIQDAHRTIPKNEFAMHLEIPLEMSKDFYRNAMQNGNWNCLFDREKEIPKIEAFLGVDLTVNA